MKIERIKISGMHRTTKTYDFGQMNYLYGSNGAGKSTVLQAIQFAVLGYIPGTDKTKTALFQHCGNGKEMSVRIEFDDGSEITRTMRKTAKGITDTITTVPDDISPISLLGNLELPVMDFNQFIGMTSNKLKEWFTAFLPDSDMQIDWNEVLWNPVKEKITCDMQFDGELINDVLSYVNGLRGSTLGAVRSTNEYLKQILSSKKQELDRLSHTVQTLVFYQDCDMSMSEDEIRDAIKAETDKINAAQDALRKVEVNSRYEAKIRDLNERLESIGDIDKLRDAYNFAESELDRFNLKLKIAEGSISDLRSAVSESKRIMLGGGVCPYMNYHCEKMIPVLSKVSEYIDTCTSEIEVQEHERAELLRKIESLKLDIKKCSSSIHDYESTQLLIEEYTGMMYLDVADLTSDSEHDKSVFSAIIEEAKSKVDDLTKQLAMVEANLRYEKLSDNLTNDTYKLESEIEVIKAWIKITDVNGLQSKIMMQPFMDLEALVSLKLNTLFQSDVKSKFVVDGKSNSFDFGMIRDGNYVSFDLLSSGEKCLYTLALTLSLVEMSDAKLKLLMVDDLLDHLDDIKIKQTFETLYNCTDGTDVQIILAGVKPCNHPLSNTFVINI